ncbi:phage tail tape measure protein [Streptomyces sp. SM8]|uniref:phage tail tape measure protein n=1 Tax=Streptomyces sp. SM8 TaxID=1195457 RepID=UPI00028310FF|nr:phage tail tape measure protein [Streptomyces sp. SM8]
MASEEVDYGSARITLDLDDSGAERQARDVGSDIERALTRATRNLGRTVRRNITRGLRGVSASVAVTPDLDGFEREIRNRVRGLRAVTVPVTADLGDFQQALRRGGGPMEVPVTPDTGGFARALRDRLRAVEAEIRVRADARTLVREVEAALRSVAPPTIPVEVEADLSRVRSQLASLDAPRVEVQLTLNEGGVRQQIEDLASTEVNVPVTVGAGGAAAAAGGAAGSAVLGGLTGALTAAGPWGAIVAAVAGFGAVIGKALMTGIAGVIEHQQIEGQLRAALGVSDGVAAQAGRVVGQLYARGVVETIEDGTAAVQAAVRNGLAAPGDIPALEAVSTQVADLSRLMEEDIGKTARAVGTMVKAGLVDNAAEGIDLLTKSVQQGGNVAEDLLDTYTEYPVQFKQLGLSAQESLGLIQQGLKAGARDSDVIADSLKEFSIEAAQGGERVVDAFKAMSLDADKLSSAFAKGGPEARAALTEIFNALQDIEDPLERNQAAVGLFGTKAEDMASALSALDLDTAAKELDGFGGAADRAGDALRDNLGAKLGTIGRELKQAFQGLFTGDFSQFADVGRAIEDALPDLKATGVKIAKSIQDGIVEYGPRVFAAVFRLASEIGQRVDIWGPLILKIIAGAAALPLVIGGLLLTAVAGALTGIGAKLLPYLETAWDAVAGFFTDTIPRWGAELGGAILDALASAWEAATGAASAGVDAVVGFFTALPGRALEALSGLGAAVGGFFSGLFVSAREAVASGASAVLDFFVQLPGQIVAGLAALPGLLLDAFTSAVAYVAIGLLTAVAGLVYIFTELPLKIWAALSSLGSTLVSAFQAGWASVTGWLASAGATVVAWFAALPGRIWAALGSLGTYLLSALSAAFASASARISSWISQAAAWFSALPGRVYSALSAFGSMLLSALASGFTAARARVTSWLSDTVGFFRTLPGRAADALSSLGSRIAGVFSRAAGAARRAVSGLIGGIVDLFRGLPGKIISAVGNIGSQIMGKIKSGLPSGVRKLLPFADGGIVTSATPALIGEAGPEVVIPLTRPRRAQQLAQQSGLVDMLTRAGVLGADAGGAPGAGGPKAVHHHTWNINEVGDAHMTAHRVIHRLTSAAVV